MTKQIIVAFSAGDSLPLGNVWRITAKKTDFYLDPQGEAAVFHLSVHGPNGRFDGHRFHIKVDRKLAASVKGQGHFLEHAIPRKGWAFDGQQIADRAFRVARIRWMWHLQRPRFQAAPAFGRTPKLDDHQSGARLSRILSPNDAWDIDLVTSYGQPYWPNAHGSSRDNARLGPLYNDSGLCLTATSYHRSQMKYPAPQGLLPRLPRPDEKPNRIMCGGPGSDADGDIYWFAETITLRELLEASRTS